MVEFCRVISGGETLNVDLLFVMSSQYGDMGKCMKLKLKGQFLNSQSLHRNKEAVQHLTAVCCSNNSMDLEDDWTNLWKNTSMTATYTWSYHLHGVSLSVKYSKT